MSALSCTTELVEQLDGDLALEAGVGALVHDAHATLAELRLHAVLAQRATYHVNSPQVGPGSGQ